MDVSCVSVHTRCTSPQMAGAFLRYMIRGRTVQPSLRTLQLKHSRFVFSNPMYFATFLQCTATENLDQAQNLQAWRFAVCFATQRQAMSRRILRLSHSDSAPSAAGAKTYDEDDGPSIFSSDFASEDAQPCTKPSKIKGQSAAPQKRGHNLLF